MSFEIAAKRLSADTLNLTVAASSAVKGETLADTAHNLEAMQPDVLVIRHYASGAPHYLAGKLNCGVINAGDGLHEHPTQALLDLLTVQEAKGRLDGLKVAIIGDIAHSRVARSDILAFGKMGSQVTVAGPATMLPPFLGILGGEGDLFPGRGGRGSRRHHDAPAATGAHGPEASSPPCGNTAATSAWPPGTWSRPNRT